MASPREPLVATVQHLNEVSKLPVSFDGNGFLYATSLCAMMSIACLGIAVCGWMVRDTWRDRYIVHPTQLLFCFRLMVGIIGFSAFIRSIPEVLYLQAYGDNDISPELVALILLGKRAADTVALGFVASWMLILVAIYPPMCIALKQGPAKQMIVDGYGTWPRLRRPAALFFIICAISGLMAYTKVYGG